MVSRSKVIFESSIRITHSNFVACSLSMITSSHLCELANQSLGEDDPFSMSTFQNKKIFWT